MSFGSHDDAFLVVGFLRVGLSPNLRSRAKNHFVKTGIYRRDIVLQ